MLKDILLPALALAAAGYLSGSVNYAIIITRVVTGKDIRAIGNFNPGTSNVVRNVGMGWGLLVMFLDGFKAFLPVLLGRLLFFSADTNIDFFILYIVGIAAVLGHRYPVFYRFKGGGSIGCMQGVSLFFIPLEFLLSMLLAGIIVLTFFKKVKFKYGQWTPIFFVILTPFLTLGLNYTVYLPLFAHISLGGHLPAVIAGSFILSLTLLGINISFMKNRVQEVRAPGK